MLDIHALELISRQALPEPDALVSAARGHQHAYSTSTPT